MNLSPNSYTWRPYFAWRPVEIGNKFQEGTQWVWLEWLERKECDAWEGAHVWSKWVYRR